MIDNNDIPCVCTICGLRWDPEQEDSLCQNGHDSWLEWRDIEMLEVDNTSLKKACKAFGMNQKQVREQFLNSYIQPFKIVKPIQL